MPPISVLIKPASSKCNLRCEYCFYHDLANQRSVPDFGLMSAETLEVIIRKVLDMASGYATFSFQGGEPTLCGLDFFKQVVRLQEKYNKNGVKINNCLQTNGFLIDSEWSQFLKQHEFLVGLSLDGPAELHDRHRKDSQGNGTFDRVMQSVSLLNNSGAEYNILFVVTNLSARHPDDLYNFFKRKNFDYLQFMPCLDPANEVRGTHKYSLSPERYEYFLKRFFDRWFVDFMSGREVSIRYFDNLVRIVAGMPYEMCSLRGACQCQFVFEADGSVYPCDFYVTDKWKLGDIREDALMELYESENCRQFIKSSLTAREACQQCRWYFLCKGGCRRDRENLRSGQPESNYFCESFKAFLACVYPRLIEAARYVQKIRSKQ